MPEYTAADGTRFTDADLKRWALDAANGYPGSTSGRTRAGRPRGRAPQPVTKQLRVQLSPEQHSKLDQIAHGRSVQPAQLIRELIDAL